MQVKHVILLTLDLNMWKLDPTRPKHVIKTNQNKKKKKSKTLNLRFWARVCVHILTWSMRTCLMYVYSYIKHAYAWNLVLKQQQNNNQTKTNMHLIQN